MKPTDLPQIVPELLLTQLFAKALQETLPQKYKNKTTYKQLLSKNITRKNNLWPIPLFDAFGHTQTTPSKTTFIEELKSAFKEFSLATYNKNTEWSDQIKTALEQKWWTQSKAQQATPTLLTDNLTIPKFTHLLLNDVTTTLSTLIDYSHPALSDFSKEQLIQHIPKTIENKASNIHTQLKTTKKPTIKDIANLQNSLTEWLILIQEKHLLHQQADDGPQRINILTNLLIISIDCHQKIDQLNAKLTIIKLASYLGLLSHIQQDKHTYNPTIMALSDPTTNATLTLLKKIETTHTLSEGYTHCLTTISNQIKPQPKVRQSFSEGGKTTDPHPENHDTLTSLYDQLTTTIQQVIPTIQAQLENDLIHLYEIGFHYQQQSNEKTAYLGYLIETTLDLNLTELTLAKAITTTTTRQLQQTCATLASLKETSTTLSTEATQTIINTIEASQNKLHWLYHTLITCINQEKSETLNQLLKSTLLQFHSQHIPLASKVFLQTLPILLPAKQLLFTFNSLLNNLNTQNYTAIRQIIGEAIKLLTPETIAPLQKTLKKANISSKNWWNNPSMLNTFSTHTRKIIMDLPHPTWTTLLDTIPQEELSTSPLIQTLIQFYEPGHIEKTILTTWLESLQNTNQLSTNYLNIITTIFKTKNKPIPLPLTKQQTALEQQKETINTLAKKMLLPFPDTTKTKEQHLWLSHWMNQLTDTLQLQLINQAKPVTQTQLQDKKTCELYCATLCAGLALELPRTTELLSIIILSLIGHQSLQQQFITQMDTELNRYKLHPKYPNILSKLSESESSISPIEAPVLSAIFQTHTHGTESQHTATKLTHLFSNLIITNTTKTEFSPLFSTIHYIKSRLNSTLDQNDIHKLILWAGQTLPLITPYQVQNPHTSHHHLINTLITSFEAILATPEEDQESLSTYFHINTPLIQTLLKLPHINLSLIPYLTTNEKYDAPLPLTTIWNTLNNPQEYAHFHTALTGELSKLDNPTTSNNSTLKFIDTNINNVIDHLHTSPDELLDALKTSIQNTKPTIQKTLKKILKKALIHIKDQGKLTQHHHRYATLTPQREQQIINNYLESMNTLITTLEECPYIDPNLTSTTIKSLEPKLRKHTKTIANLRLTNPQTYIMTLAKLEIIHLTITEKKDPTEQEKGLIETIQETLQTLLNTLAPTSMAHQIFRNYILSHQHKEAREQLKQTLFSLDPTNQQQLITHLCTHPNVFKNLWEKDTQHNTQNKATLWALLYAQTKHLEDPQTSAYTNHLFQAIVLSQKHLQECCAQLHKNSQTLYHYASNYKQNIGTQKQLKKILETYLPELENDKLLSRVETSPLDRIHPTNPHFLFKLTQNIDTLLQQLSDTFTEEKTLLQHTLDNLILSLTRELTQNPNIIFSRVKSWFSDWIQMVLRTTEPTNQTIGEIITASPTQLNRWLNLIKENQSELSNPEQVIIQLLAHIQFFDTKQHKEFIYRIIRLHQVTSKLDTLFQLDIPPKTQSYYLDTLFDQLPETTLHLMNKVKDPKWDAPKFITQPLTQAQHDKTYHTTLQYIGIRLASEDLEKWLGTLTNNHTLLDLFYTNPENFACSPLSLVTKKPDHPDHYKGYTQLTLWAQEYEKGRSKNTLNTLRNILTQLIEKHPKLLANYLEPLLIRHPNTLLDVLSESSTFLVEWLIEDLIQVQNTPYKCSLLSYEKLAQLTPIKLQLISSSTTTINQLPAPLLKPILEQNPSAFLNITEETQLTKAIQYLSQTNAIQLLSPAIDTILPACVSSISTAFNTSKNQPMSAVLSDIALAKDGSTTSLTDSEAIHLLNLAHEKQDLLIQTIKTLIQLHDRSIETLITSILGSPLFLAYSPQRIHNLTELIKALTSWTEYEHEVEKACISLMTRDSLPSDIIFLIKLHLIRVDTHLEAHELLTALQSIETLPHPFPPNHEKTLCEALQNPTYQEEFYTLYKKNPRLFLNILLLPQFPKALYTTQTLSLLSHTSPLLEACLSCITQFNNTQTVDFLTTYIPPENVGEALYPKYKKIITNLLKKSETPKSPEAILERILKVTNQNHPIVDPQDPIMTIGIEHLINYHQAPQDPIEDYLNQLSKTKEMNLEYLQNKLPNRIGKQKLVTLWDCLSQENFLQEDGTLTGKWLLTPKSTIMALLQSCEFDEAISEKIIKTLKSNLNQNAFNQEHHYKTQLEKESHFRKEFLKRLLEKQTTWSSPLTKNILKNWQHQESLLNLLKESSHSSDEKLMIEQWLQHLLWDLTSNDPETSQTFSKIEQKLELLECFSIHLNQDQQLTCANYIANQTQSLIKGEFPLVIKHINQSKHLNALTIQTLLTPLAQDSRGTYAKTLLQESTTPELFIHLWHTIINHVPPKYLRKHLLHKGSKLDTLLLNFVEQTTITEPETLLAFFTIQNEDLIDYLTSLIDRTYTDLTAGKKSHTKANAQYLLISIIHTAVWREDKAFLRIIIQFVKHRAENNQEDLKWLFDTILECGHISHDLIRHIIQDHIEDPETQAHHIINQLVEQKLLSQKHYITGYLQPNTAITLDLYPYPGPQAVKTIKLKLQELLNFRISSRSTLLEQLCNWAPELLYKEIPQEHKDPEKQTLLLPYLFINIEHPAFERLLEDLITALNNPESDSRASFLNFLSNLSFPQIKDLILTTSRSLQNRNILVHILLKTSFQFKAYREKYKPRHIFNALIRYLLQDLKKPKTKNQNIAYKETILCLYTTSPSRVHPILRSYPITDTLNINLTHLNELRTKLLHYNQTMNRQQNPLKQTAKYLISQLEEHYELTELITAAESYETRQNGLLNAFIEALDYQFTLYTTRHHQHLHSQDEHTNLWKASYLLSTYQPGAKSGMVPVQQWFSIGQPKKVIRLLQDYDLINASGKILTNGPKDLKEKLTNKEFIQQLLDLSTSEHQRVNGKHDLNTKKAKHLLKKINTLFSTHSKTKELDLDHIHLLFRRLTKEGLIKGEFWEKLLTTLTKFNDHLIQHNLAPLHDPQIQLPIHSLFTDKDPLKLNVHRLTNYLDSINAPDTFKSEIQTLFHLHHTLFILRHAHSSTWLATFQDFITSTTRHQWRALDLILEQDNDDVLGNPCHNQLIHQVYIHTHIKIPTFNKEHLQECAQTLNLQQTSRTNKLKEAFTIFNHPLAPHLSRAQTLTRLLEQIEPLEQASLGNSILETEDDSIM